MVITRVAAFETDEGKPAHDEFWLPVGASMKSLKALWEAWNSIQFIYNEDGTLFGMLIEPDAYEASAIEAWLSQNFVPVPEQWQGTNFQQVAMPFTLTPAEVSYRHTPTVEHTVSENLSEGLDVTKHLKMWHDFNQPGKNNVH